MSKSSSRDSSPVRRENTFKQFKHQVKKWIKPKLFNVRIYRQNYTPYELAWNRVHVLLVKENVNCSKYTDVIVCMVKHAYTNLRFSFELQVLLEAVCHRRNPNRALARQFTLELPVKIANNELSHIGFWNVLAQAMNDNVSFIYKTGECGYYYTKFTHVKSCDTYGSDKESYSYAFFCPPNLHTDTLGTLTEVVREEEDPETASKPGPSSSPGGIAWSMIISMCLRHLPTLLDDGNFVPPTYRGQDPIGDLLRKAKADFPQK
jgi:hypothetical protein